MTIFDELKKLAEIIAKDENIGQIDRMYQVRYVVINNEKWVVDSQVFQTFRVHSEKIEKSIKAIGSYLLQGKSRSYLGWYSPVQMLQTLM